MRILKNTSHISSFISLYELLGYGMKVLGTVYENEEFRV